MVRLKCPKCANIIDAPAGSTPTCPMCGFSASAASVRPAAPARAAGAASAPASPFSPPAAPTPFSAPLSPLSPPDHAPLPRPGWVVMVAVFQFIGGGFAILGGLVVALVGGFVAEAIADEIGRFGDALGGVIVVLGVLFLLFGVLNILLGVNNLQGRQWARITSIVLAAISGAFNAFSLIMGNPAAFLSLAFDVLIIVGLSLAPTTAWFAQQGQRAAA